MNILDNFSPLLNSALERFQRFNNPEPRDLQKIFGPALETICNVAGVDPARATERISSWDPAAVTMETLHTAVRELTAPAMAEETDARARQAEIEAQIAADAAAHPLTARDRVLLERKKPLAERSRDSILAELFEARTGRIRGAVNGRYAESGERLPDIVWGHIAERETELQNELDARDLRAHGIEPAPVKDERLGRPDLAYLPVMRG
jgi:hypothetical protein